MYILLMSLVMVTAQPFPMSPNETKTIDAINHYRAQHNLPPMTMDPTLMKVARHRVKVYSHSAYGCSSRDEAEAAGFHGMVTDILAQGQRSPQEAVESWAGSYGHAQGMKGYINMNRRWTNYHLDRIGVAHCGNNWIAVLGKRQ